MSPDASEPSPPASDAALVAALFAVDPCGLGGIAVRARAGPRRDAWLALLRASLPPAQAIRRLPLHAGDNRLLGGLDLAATLSAGRPMIERGILAETDGGILLLAMAERIAAVTVAHLARVLDSQDVLLERDGLTARFAARIGMVALDEGIDDEHPHPALLERLAFRISLAGEDSFEPAADGAAIEAARACLAEVEAEDAILTVLSETALVLGIASLRAELFALRAAKAAAALAGRLHVEEADVVLAARLVLAPRATRLPSSEAPQPAESVPPAQEPNAPEEAPPPDAGGETEQTPSSTGLDEIVVAAALAAIPPGLLAQLQAAAQNRARQAQAGQAGALRQTLKRGRPVGVRRGEPRGGARLSIIETLRAAAPWQRLRSGPAGGEHRRIKIRPDDFRVARLKQRSETTTIFVVDASGSLALSRLAEAKGAVELLLADCYVRRDQVALLAFRGKGADLILPPTRSLVRAKRLLAGLPGGGATPLARAIDEAIALGEQLRRRGQTPVIVFLTDGRGNMARDGTSGRGQAEADALSSARAAKASGIRTLVVDAGQRPQPPAQRLALEMAAIYVPLPHADAKSLSATIRAASS